MPSQITNYQCPSCTGPLHYDGASGKLQCDYCGSSFTTAEIEKIYQAKLEEAEQAATWTLDGETLTVTVDGEDMTLTLQDGALKGEQGGMGMCFGREKVEAEVYEPAAIVEDAVEADYAGTWKSKYMEMKGNYSQASMFSMDLTAVIDGATMTLDGMYVFENATMESAFSGGALTHEGGDDEMYAGITAQLLEDGTMKLTFDTGDEPLILIMEKAE